MTLAPSRVRPLTVLLVDDHPVVREGLRSVLNADRGVELLGEAASAHEALKMAADLKPDVVLMDINLPGMSGLEATREIKKQLPDVEVVLLTVYDSPMYLIESIRSGAAGYILKDACQDLIPTAIRAARDGGMVLPCRLLRQAVDGLSGASRRGGAAPPGSFSAASQLTVREMDVLRLLTRGATNKAMAAELHLAEVTIKKYVQSVMAKLGAADRTDAALQGVRLGLVE